MRERMIQWREGLLIMLVAMVAFGFYWDVKKFEWIEDLRFRNGIRKMQTQYASMDPDHQKLVLDLILSLDAFEDTVTKRLDRIDAAIRLPFEERKEFLKESKRQHENVNEKN